VLATSLTISAVADLAVPKVFDRDRGRQRHTNGVGHLEFTALGQACSDDVLGE